MMPPRFHNYERLASRAIRHFWTARQQASLPPHERASAVAGKHLDGLVELIKWVVIKQGLPETAVHVKRTALALPGYFRPTKIWDVLVTSQGTLVAAIELKSHLGPSFGNNFNNRCEEAIGSAQDFWTAYRDGAFGSRPAPFLGWVMVVEDCPRSQTPIQNITSHFPVFPEFRDTSYIDRYRLLSEKLMLERLYSAVCLITTKPTDRETGEYKNLNDATSLNAFLASLTGHISSHAAH